MIETEIKLAIDSPRQGRARLLRAGFELSRKRVFEVNLVLDTPEAALRKAGKLLRLRQAGADVRMTFKGVALPGVHKSREEFEIGLTSLPEAERIFAELGYRPMFRYEKFRTEFKDPRRGGGHAMLDETPAGNFIELEGRPEWIDRRAGELGFPPTAYVTLSYGALYVEFRRKNPDAPADMVFGK